jgi:electron transport complex protein RnfD
VATEYICKRLRNRAFVMDGSAVVTGILLGLILPPTIPLWMVAIGSIFAISIVKEAFGGLGHNIFNPALGARAFMSASFSMQMTTWVLPMGFGADAVTSATPLSGSSVWQQFDPSAYQAMFLGNTTGSIGETSALLILIGGILLLALGIINWRIPAVYIGMVALMAVALGQDPLFHILAGGLMLGAFFMATDYVTSPLTNKGKIIFSVALGAMTVMIRQFGGMPEGVCYSILFMNAITPLIDRYTKVRPYGLVERVESAS